MRVSLSISKLHEQGVVVLRSALFAYCIPVDNELTIIPFWTFHFFLLVVSCKVFSADEGYQAKLFCIIIYFHLCKFQTVQISTAFYPFVERKRTIVYMKVKHYALSKYFLIN